MFMKNIHGGDIYKYENVTDFSANINPMGIPESVREAVVNSLEMCENYPQMFCDDLREKIGRRHGVDSSFIICGNGASDVLYRYVFAIKPKNAVVAAPCFAEYEAALECVGAKVEYYQINHNTFEIEDDFMEMFEYKPDMIFLCNPNNPTGILINDRLLERIIKECDRNGVRIFLDECFLDFMEEPGRYTLKAQLSRYHNLFLLKAFTKRYAMAGIRLGYGITENTELLDAMTQVTQPWNISVMAQAAGIAALKETAYVEEGRQMVFREAKYLKEELQRLGMEVFPSEANYIFFHGPENLFEICVEQGVLIRDCSNYSGLRKGYYRVAVRTHEENQELIRAMRDGTTKAAVAHAEVLKEEEQA